MENTTPIKTILLFNDGISQIPEVMAIIDSDVATLCQTHNLELVGHRLAMLLGYRVVTVELKSYGRRCNVMVEVEGGFHREWQLYYSKPFEMVDGSTSCHTALFESSVKE